MPADTDYRQGYVRVARDDLYRAVNALQKITFRNNSIQQHNIDVVVKLLEGMLTQPRDDA